MGFCTCSLWEHVKILGLCNLIPRLCVSRTPLKSKETVDSAGVRKPGPRRRTLMTGRWGCLSSSSAGRGARASGELTSHEGAVPQTWTHGEPRVFRVPVSVARWRDPQKVSGRYRTRRPSPVQVALCTFQGWMQGSETLHGDRREAGWWWLLQPAREELPLPETPASLGRWERMTSICWSFEVIGCVCYTADITLMNTSLTYLTNINHADVYHNIFNSFLSLDIFVH